MTDFREFGKIPRLSRECVITEKIDGTNAQIYIGDDGEFLTGSRTRWITPEDDNFGFSKWAHAHKDELLTLGPGHHFGEWWGVGIQRGYGLSERRFSLFNTSRWSQPGAIATFDVGDLRVEAPACCHVVPVLSAAVFSTEVVSAVISQLKLTGSIAAPGFANPEGVVVYHTAGGHYYKKTCEHDDEPKNAHVKKDRLPQIKQVKVGGIMWTGGRRHGPTPGYAGPERRKG